MGAAEPRLEPDTLPYYLRAAPDLEPYVQEEEQRTQADLNTILPEQRERTLIRHLIATRLNYLYETVYALIFGGQLNLLNRALQAGEEGLSRRDVRERYEETLRSGNWTENVYPESTFIHFLTDQRLLEHGEDDRYRITPIGRGFRRYLSAVGRPLMKVP